MAQSSGYHVLRGITNGATGAFLRGETTPFSPGPPVLQQAENAAGAMLSGGLEALLTGQHSENAPDMGQLGKEALSGTLRAGAWGAASMLGKLPELRRQKMCCF